MHYPCTFIDISHLSNAITQQILFPRQMRDTFPLQSLYAVVYFGALQCAMHKSKSPCVQYIWIYCLSSFFETSPDLWIQFWALVGNKRKKIFFVHSNQTSKMLEWTKQYYI